MAKEISSELLNTILTRVGGPGNIASCGNCMTRLRLGVHDSSLVDPNIKTLEGVKGVILTSDQVQVVFGPGKVHRAAKAMSELLGEAPVQDAAEIAAQNKRQLKAKQTSGVQQFLAKFATIFTPLIPGFIAAGLLLGIATLIATVMHVPADAQGTLPDALNFMKVFSKGLFTFLVILVGYNAAQAFGGTGVNGAIIAALFLLGYNPAATTGYYAGFHDFFGLPIDPRGNIIGVLDEMRQAVVKTSAFMGQFIADTDFTCISAIDFISGNNNKSGRVSSVSIYILFQHGKTEKFSSIGTGDSCLGMVSFFCDFLGCSSCVSKFMSYPLFVRLQEDSALHKGLRMGIDICNFFHGSSRKTYQSMLTGDDLFPYDYMVILGQQVIIVLDNACSRIFYRQNSKISVIVFDCFHGIFPGIYMKTFDVFSKKSIHGGIAVSTFYSLEHYSDVFFFQSIYRGKKRIPCAFMFLHKLILALSADRHDLPVEFINSSAVKLSGSLTAEGLQFCLLSAGIKNRFLCLYFKPGHLFRHGHSLFKKPDDLIVDMVDFISELGQI